MLSYDDFEKAFEGKTAEELESVKQFAKLYCQADQDTREAIGEVLEGCQDGNTTLAEAINHITNEATRKRWIEAAQAAGVYNDPVELTA